VDGKIRRAVRRPDSFRLGARVVSRLPRSGGEVLLEYAMLPADTPAYGLVEYGFFFLLLIFNVFL
jgi:hypothetical protein